MPSFWQRNNKPIFETNDLKNRGRVVKSYVGSEPVITFSGYEFVTTVTPALTNGAAWREQRRIRRKLQG
jgi:hypothetical protein